MIWGLLGEFDGLVAILFLCIRGSRRQRVWLGIWHIKEGNLCGIRIILCLVLRPSLHGHYLSVRLQLLLSLSGFVGMMIATDVYFLQFHNCVVYLRVLCVELCQRLLRNLVLPYLVECCYRSFGTLGPGGSMSYVVGLPNNSWKPITNTAWVRARLCKLQKRVHSTRRKWISSHKVNLRHAI